MSPLPKHNHYPLPEPYWNTVFRGGNLKQDKLKVWCTLPSNAVSDATDATIFRSLTVREGTIGASVNSEAYSWQISHTVEPLVLFCFVLQKNGNSNRRRNTTIPTCRQSDRAANKKNTGRATV